jgi:tRNA dimethylallyltransferase
MPVPKPRSGLVLALFGPTASGKSAVAEALADRTGGEVVSADAMQAYRGLPLITNQPDRPTRLVGVWPLDHDGSVGEYQRLAHAAIDELLAAGRVPVVAGGTGLYLRAALAELEPPPPPVPGARQRWEAAYDADPARTHAALAERDPAAAAAVHAHDRRRVVRALELSEVGASLARAQDSLWSGETRHPTLVFGLAVAKDVLERRIGQRVDAMLAAGAADEARHALAGGISRTAAQALGLRELAELPTEQARSAVILRTRRYAAYQRKWMRRIPGIVMIEADRPAKETADAILEVARARQQLPARRAE